MATKKTKKTANRQKKIQKPRAVAPKPTAKPAEPGAVVLGLRTVCADGHARGTYDGKSWDFAWPALGPVACPDWNPEPKCGGGLHFLPRGDGDWGLLSSAADALWQVIQVDPADMVTVGSDKAKCRACVVLFTGSRGEALTRLLCGAEAMTEAQRTARECGNYSTAASSGNYSKAASSGNYSTAASSGNYSTAASSGNSSTAASSGNYSTAASSGNSSKAASSGDYSTAASSGNYSTAASSGNSSKAASSGNYSTAASSGDYSTAASSGNYSTAASSGNYSTAASSGNSSKAASSGDSGIAATIGNSGHATAGPLGLVIVTYWVEAEKRHRACVGNVGEAGILADTWYKAVDGKLVPV